jgi:hypothetical protein
VLVGSIQRLVTIRNLRERSCASLRDPRRLISYGQIEEVCV